MLGLMLKMEVVPGTIIGTAAIEAKRKTNPAVFTGNE